MLDRAPAPELLRTEALVKRYGGIVAADGIAISVAHGQVYGVIGPNGAGKSTFIGLLGGALTPTSGRIFFEGRDVSATSAALRARMGIGRTYQIPRPFLDMTVAENLEVSQFSRDVFVSARAARAERDAILEQTGLADAAHLQARMLPLLRRKRLEVARALALRPKLLLLDEVGAGLVDSEVTELIALIRALATPDRAIIIVEHVIRVVRECCERLLVLNFGKPFAEGPMRDVLASDDVAAVYLGTSHGAKRETSVVVPRAEPRSAAEPLLALSGIKAGYGLAKVLNGVDLEICRGQAVAILGTNGAGKTTLAKVIDGSLKATSGQIRFAGADITALQPHQVAARGVAHCMEGRRIFVGLTVEENLRLAARNVSAAETKRRLDEIYALFPILHERRATPGTSMSGGQQQMLAIGRALMSKPALVIFDEISLGLAPVVMDQLYMALGQLRQTGLTMLLVEQDVERALDLADHAHVLERGVFALSGTSTEIRNDARLRQLYIGEAD